MPNESSNPPSNNPGRLLELRRLVQADRDPLPGTSLEFKWRPCTGTVISMTWETRVRTEPRKDKLRWAGFFLAISTQPGKLQSDPAGVPDSFSAVYFYGVAPPGGLVLDISPSASIQIRGAARVEKRASQNADEAR